MLGFDFFKSHFCFEKKIEKKRKIIRSFLAMQQQIVNCCRERNRKRFFLVNINDLPFSSNSDSSFVFFYFFQIKSGAHRSIRHQKLEEMRLSEIDLGSEFVHVCGGVFAGWSSVLLLVLLQMFFAKFARQCNHSIMCDNNQCDDYHPNPISFHFIQHSSFLIQQIFAFTNLIQNKPIEL